MKVGFAVAQPTLPMQDGTETALEDSHVRHERRADHMKRNRTAMHRYGEADFDVDYLRW